MREENSRLREAVQLLRDLRMFGKGGPAEDRANDFLARIDAEAAGEKSAVPRSEPLAGEERAPVLHLPEPTYEDLLKGIEVAKKYLARTDAALAHGPRIAKGEQ